MKKSKPRNLKTVDYYYAGIGFNYDELKNNIYIGGVDSLESPKQIQINDLKFAKRLHKWLGQAIKYLEYKNESY